MTLADSQLRSMLVTFSGARLAQSIGMEQTTIAISVTRRLLLAVLSGKKRRGLSRHSKSWIIKHRYLAQGSSTVCLRSSPKLGVGKRQAGTFCSLAFGANAHCLWGDSILGTGNQMLQSKSALSRAAFPSAAVRGLQLIYEANSTFFTESSSS